MKQIVKNSGRYEQLRNAQSQSATYGKWRQADTTYTNAPFALASISHTVPPSTPGAARQDGLLRASD